MSDEATVTAVIPCFNHGRFLAESVASLVAQTLPTWRAMIVDDGSTDGVTPALADREAADPRVTVLHLPENRGRSLARNAGIEAATTEAVFSLDSDDVLDPAHFAITVPLLLSDRAVGIVYTDYRRFGGQQGLLRGAPFDASTVYRRRYIWAGSLYRRSAWARTEGYRDAFRDGNEDYDFFLSLLEAGYVGRYVPRPLVNYRSHVDSWTSSGVGGGDRVYRSRLRLYEYHREGFDRAGATRRFLVETHHEEARRLAHLGQRAKAREILDRALALAPFHPALHVTRWLVRGRDAPHG